MKSRDFLFLVAGGVIGAAAAIFWPSSGDEYYRCMKETLSAKKETQFEEAHAACKHLPKRR